MTLFEQIQTMVPLGWNISFRNEPFNLAIEVTKTINGKTYKKESWLPTSDHFYEQRIIDCIQWMEDEIRKENTTQAITE